MKPLSHLLIQIGKNKNSYSYYVYRKEQSWVEKTEEEEQIADDALQGALDESRGAATDKDGAQASQTLSSLVHETDPVHTQAAF